MTPAQFAHSREPFLTIVSEIIAQLIPQTIFCCKFPVKITECIPAPIFAVLFTLFHPEQISGEKIPSAIIAELIPVGFFGSNQAVIELPNEFPETIFAPGIYFGDNSIQWFSLVRTELKKQGTSVNQKGTGGRGRDRKYHKLSQIVVTFYDECFDDL